MRAVTFRGPGEVAVEDVEAPALRADTDAVVEVSVTALCGSDLHVYHGEIPGVMPGSVLGHEYAGRVLAAGDAVRRFETGDRVVGPFHVACGACPACGRGEHHQCEEGGVLGYGLAFGDLDGAQAERVRIPHADVNLRPIPRGLDDEAALFAGDVLSTAFGALRKGRLRPGETVAVLGCGPVGQLVVACAMLCGAARVLAIDRVAARAERAAELGATPIATGEAGPVGRVQELTGGEGADLVVEAVGGAETLELAFDLVRGGGRISAVGITAEEAFDYPLMSALVRDLEFRMGIANVHRDIDDVLALLAAGRVDPLAVVSHRLPLEEAAEAYRLFAAREADKVLLLP